MGTRMKESVTNKIVFAGRKTLNIKVGGCHKTREYWGIDYRPKTYYKGNSNYSEV